jgi:hypothetical protein
VALALPVTAQLGRPCAGGGSRGSSRGRRGADSRPRGCGYRNRRTWFLLLPLASPPTCSIRVTSRPTCGLDVRDRAAAAGPAAEAYQQGALGGGDGRRPAVQGGRQRAAALRRPSRRPRPG